MAVRKVEQLLALATLVAARRAKIKDAHVPNEPFDRDAAFNLQAFANARQYQGVVRETGGEQTPWLVRQDLLGDFAVF